MEADKIKDSIKRAAQDLFRKFGYHKTSVNEIAKNDHLRKGAGISTMTVSRARGLGAVITYCRLRASISALLISP